MTSHRDEQRERWEIWRNEQRLRRERGATYHDFAVADAEAGHNRYSEISKQHVTASEPVVYPAQPENSPWRCDPVPDEPPLGVAIDEMVPVGEVFEVEASMREASDGFPPLTIGASQGGGIIKAATPDAAPPSKRGRRR